MSKSKAATNRENAKKSTGPADTSVSRYNARSHGLLSVGVTELDEDLYQPTLERFNRDFRPATFLEEMLVERLALTQVRLRRSAMLEAEFIADQLHPPPRAASGPHPLISAMKLYLDPASATKEEEEEESPKRRRLSISAIDVLGQKFQRYETSLENRFFRTLNELERLQRLRGGDVVPPPMTVNVALHDD